MRDLGARDSRRAATRCVGLRGGWVRGARLRGARPGCGRAGGFEGELAGAPEGEDLLKAGEQAQQGGDDEGMHRGNHPMARGQVVRRSTESGRDGREVLGEGGLVSHDMYYA